MKSTNEYTWNAEDYAANSSFQLNLANELISKLNLIGNEVILDIGCGDGKITAKIASLVPSGKVVGIDSSEQMISFARETYNSSKIKNISFEIMNALEIKFKNDFDIVFSNAALHWVKDHKTVLHGINKSLIPGGRILLQMGGKGNAASLLEIINEMILNPDWKKYFENLEFPYGFYSVEKYKTWLKETGFEINRVELIPKNNCYDNKEGLAKWIRTTWLPYLERIPFNKCERFINELTDNYCKKNPIGIDGKIHVGMMRLEVDACKPF